MIFDRIGIIRGSVANIHIYYQDAYKDVISKALKVGALGDTVQV
jgi:hypothetical protein